VRYRCLKITRHSEDSFRIEKQGNMATHEIITIYYNATWDKTKLTPKGPKAIFRPFLKFEQAIVKAIFIKNSWIKFWIGGLVLASRRTNFYMIPIFGLVLMSQNAIFFSIRATKKLFIIKFFSWNFFHWFSFKFLNIYLTDPNSRTYTFYVINCKRFYKL
jgi:hypothetical protein